MRRTSLKQSKSSILTCILLASALITPIFGQEVDPVTEELREAYQQGNKEHFIALLKEAIQLRPKDNDLLHLLAIQLLQEGRLEEGEHYAGELVRRSPDNLSYQHTLYTIRIKPHLELSDHCRSAGDYACALREAKALIKVDPRVPLGYTLLGSLLVLRQQSGDFLLAGSVFQQGLVAQASLPSLSPFRLSNPELSHIYTGLGIASYETGDYVAAESAFRKALELDPTIVDGQYNLNLAIRERERSETHSVEWLSLSDVLSAIDNVIHRR